MDHLGCVAALFKVVIKCAANVLGKGSDARPLDVVSHHDGCVANENETLGLIIFLSAMHVLRSFVVRI